MARYQRIKGGEKNKKSGQKWSEEELTKVLNLYLSEKGFKVHESNIKIQQLAKEIDRTTRSVEAQLLMFRNLDRHGDYAYGNMNKLCEKLWVEYLNKTK